MFGPFLSAGLRLPASGGLPAEARDALTAEAALTPDPGEALRVDLLVAEGAAVTQGQPLMTLRAAPEIALVAPMAGRVARIDLGPGRVLSQLVLFHDAAGGRHAFDLTGAGAGAGALALLMQGAGLWRRFRSRPFGRAPKAGETPAAIVVMGYDSTPDAPPVTLALAGREDDLMRGLAALSRLTEGPVFYAAPDRPADLPDAIRFQRCGVTHPQGLAGMVVHRVFPASVAAPVWDIHAEDLADLGALLATGHLPETRLVSVTGDALREARLLRCQHGADLRGLSQSVLRPGPHEVLSGSVLDGRPAHWLGPRDRQVSVLGRAGGAGGQAHWFRAALNRAARHAPIIPTAALEQSLGGGLPAAALIRVLASGDQEGFTRLGGLSLTETDIALADYATGARPRLAGQLRAMLDRIATEENAL
ncbi:MAG: Na(+)-translocating NADH-quinone reductase subunit A [Paracoccus sp. (in: a-proteobacteria)]|nr:Na(+)-translocating NADH-quinone reductase subunit A [Paracoccus sp. (in: a-proteobacteria)]